MEEKTLFLRPPIWLPIAIALILGGSFVMGKKIELRGAPSTISISGEGKVSAVPDIASLSFGVQTGRQKTAQSAMEMLSKNMNAVLDAVKNQGIAEKDIGTESLSLYPAYDWNDGKQTPRGFEASQSLRVKVRDLDKIGAVLSAATNAGANQAGGVSFTIDDPNALQAAAREKAIEDAKKKARILANDLGVSIGKLMGFSEGGGFPPTPMYARAEMMDRGMGGGGSDPLPLPSGEQEVHVMVTLTYEID
jgi:uncharacterized protein